MRYYKKKWNSFPLLNGLFDGGKGWLGESPFLSSLNFDSDESSNLFEYKSGFSSSLYKGY